jgi:hypothetical protein
MRRLYKKERQSPHCTILMGQRLRDRECEFVPTFKYGTVKLKRRYVGIIYLILALLPTFLTQDLLILVLMVIITLISIKRGVISDRKNN